jgi:ribonuclease D
MQESPAMTAGAVATSQPDIARLAELARAGGRIGLDTEFMSEGRYRALLCLVQIVVPEPEADDGQRIEVIDTLAPYDASPLAEVLADPDVEVVVHAGRQDVALLRREWRTEITRLFDTQVAAAFAGFSAQSGYETLLRGLLGVRLGKTASFTRWDRRPLTEEQLAYAREDVEHLLPMADELERRLGSSGRIDWARQECAPLEASTDERDPEQAFRRLPKVAQLRPKAAAVARELAGWRELTAKQENRPVGSVLADAPLVEIAKRQPSEVKALEEIRGMHPRILRRYGPALLEAVERGLEGEPVRLEDDRKAFDSKLAPLVSLTEALVRSTAIEEGVAYELLATRAELQALVAAARTGADEPGVRMLEGWRRELVGEEVLALLAGERLVHVEDNGMLRIEER